MIGRAWQLIIIQSLLFLISTLILYDNTHRCSSFCFFIISLVGYLISLATHTDTYINTHTQSYTFTTLCKTSFFNPQSLWVSVVEEIRLWQWVAEPRWKSRACNLGWPDKSDVRENRNAANRKGCRETEQDQTGRFTSPHFEEHGHMISFLYLHVLLPFSSASSAGADDWELAWDEFLSAIIGYCACLKFHIITSGDASRFKLSFGKLYKKSFFSFFSFFFFKSRHMNTWMLPNVTLLTNTPNGKCTRYP